MKRIRGAYMSNLPILRGRFLNSLLMGNVGEQEIQEKLNDYQIKLDGKYFMTALVTGDDLMPFLKQSDEYKSDLPALPFIIFLQRSWILPGGSELSRCG